MNNLFSWFTRKAEPIPHLAEVRGLTRKMAERKLRTLGFSRSGAKHFYYLHAAAIRGE